MAQRLELEIVARDLTGGVVAQSKVQFDGIEKAAAAAARGVTKAFNDSGITVTQTVDRAVSSAIRRLQTLESRFEAGPSRIGRLRQQSEQLQKVFGGSGLEAEVQRTKAVFDKAIANEKAALDRRDNMRALAASRERAKAVSADRARGAVPFGAVSYEAEFAAGLKRVQQADAAISKIQRDRAIATESPMGRIAREEAEALAMYGISSEKQIAIQREFAQRRNDLLRQDAIKASGERAKTAMIVGPVMYEAEFGAAMKAMQEKDSQILRAEQASSKTRMSVRQRLAMEEEQMLVGATESQQTRIRALFAQRRPEEIRQARMDAFSKFGMQASMASISMTAAVSAPLILAGQQAIDAFSEIEAARIGFETLTGSRQKGFQHVVELQQFAARTPFDFMSLLENSRLMQAMGFKVEEVIPVLTSVGDAVATFGGSNEKINSVIMQIAQMRAKQKMTWQDLKFITEAGIPAVDILGEQVRKPGMAQKQVADAVFKGLEQGRFGVESLDRFIHDLELRFSGGMSRMAGTVKQQLSNLRDNMTITFAEIGQGIAPTIKNFIGMGQSALGVIRDMAAGFSQLPEGVRSFVVTLLGLTAAAGPALFTMGGIASMIPFIEKGLLALRAATIWMFTSPWGLVIMGVSALMYLLGTLRDRTIEHKTALDDQIASLKVEKDRIESGTVAVRDRAAAIQDLNDKLLAMETARQNIEANQQLKDRQLGPIAGGLSAPSGPMVMGQVIGRAMGLPVSPERRPFVGPMRPENPEDILQGIRMDREKKQATAPGGPPEADANAKQAANALKAARTETMRAQREMMLEEMRAAAAEPAPGELASPDNVRRRMELALMRVNAEINDDIARRKQEGTLTPAIQAELEKQRQIKSQAALNQLVRTQGETDEKYYRKRMDDSIKAFTEEKDKQKKAETEFHQATEKFDVERADRRLAAAQSELSRERDLALLNIQTVNAQSLREKLALEDQKLAIEQEYLRRSLALDLIKLERERRNELADLDRRAALLPKTDESIRAIAEQRATIEGKYADERSEIVAAENAKEVQGARQSQIEKQRLVIESTRRMYDSLKQSASGVFDALFSRTQSFGEALKNTIKTAVLTPIKEILASQTAALLTRLLTGQNVTFSDDSLPGGRFAGIRSTLSRLGLGTPQFGAGNRLLPKLEAPNHLGDVSLVNGAVPVVLTNASPGGSQSAAQAARASAGSFLPKLALGGALGAGALGIFGAFGGSAKAAVVNQTPFVTSAFKPLTADTVVETFGSAANTGGVSVGDQVSTANSLTGNTNPLGWASILGPGGTSGFAGPVSGLGGTSGSVGGMSIFDPRLYATGNVPGMGSGSGVWANLKKNVSTNLAGLKDFLGIGGSVQTGAGTATTWGAATLGQKIGSIAKSNAALMGGAMLAMDGIRRGGIGGMLETAGGGALIGFKYGGPIGALIGGAIGGAVGFARLFIKSAEEKAKEKIRTAYGIDVKDKGVLKQIVDIAKQTYGGNLDMAIRSPQVRELLELYAMSTGQNMGIQPRVRAANIAQTTGGLFQAGVYENGRNLTFAGMPSLGPSTTIPSNPGSVGYPTNYAPMNVNLTLNPQQTLSVFRGQSVQAISEAPRTATKAVNTSLRGNSGRREQAALLLSPGTLPA